MDKIKSKSVDGAVFDTRAVSGAADAAESKEMQMAIHKLEQAEIYIDEYRVVLGDMVSGWEGKTIERPLSQTPGATYYYEGNVDKPEKGPSQFYRLDCQSGDVTVGHVDGYGIVEEYPFLALDKIATNLVVPSLNWEAAFKKFLEVAIKKQKLDAEFKAICKTKPDYSVK